MSYSNITLAVNTHFTWNYPYVDGAVIISDINDLTVSIAGLEAYMPYGGNIELGTSVIFNNLGPNIITLMDFYGGITVATIAVGSVVKVYLTGTTDTSDLWNAIQMVGGSLGIVNLAVTSADATLAITGSPVNASESGNIVITANPQIAALGSLASEGILVSTATDASAIVTRTLVGGNGITLTNPNGSTGNIGIAIDDSVSNLVSFNVGNLDFSASTIASTTKADFQISSFNTGLLDLNTVTIDTAGNITIPATATFTTTTAAATTLTIGDTTFTTDTITDASGLTINTVEIDKAGNVTIPTAATLTTPAAAITALTIGSTNIIAKTITDVNGLNINNVAIDKDGNLTTPYASTMTVPTLNANIAAITGLTIDSTTFAAKTITDANGLNINNVTIDTAGNSVIPNAASLTVNTINSSSKNDLTLNGIVIDPTSNLTTTGTITAGNITGATITASSISLTTPYVQPGGASSMGFYSDNNTLTTTPAGNMISTQGLVNIASITGANGSYIVNFTQPYLNSEYIVQITLTNSISSITPMIAFFANRNLSNFSIYTLDYRGNLIPATAGLCFSVWGTLKPV